jgi:stage V sporulation protein AE
MSAIPTDGKRRVIVITDGDQMARKAVESAARQVGARVISRSAGNPTPLSGRQIISLVQQAHHDPVLVMFDDNGHSNQSYGEQALREIMDDPSIEVIGAIAVASNTEHVNGVHVNFSLDQSGNVVHDGVNKDGLPQGFKEPTIFGDTVDVLKEYSVPIIVGVGDIGKMEGKDSYWKGAPVTTQAITEILKRSGDRAPS